MSQVEVLTAVRDHNGLRTSSNQEYIGGLFFLIALAMVQHCVGIGFIQAYVLPLRRFQRVHKIFASPKAASFIYALLLSGLYFLITATGGLSGYVIISGLLLLWATILVFIGLIRRCLRRKKEKEDEHTFDNPADVPDDTNLNESKKPTEIIGNARREVREKSPWASCPAAIAPWQLGAVFINTALLLLNLMTILLIVYLWDISEYQLVTPHDVPVAEVQPPLAAKALQFMYVYPEFAQKFQLDVYTKLFTEYCGATYTLDLTSHGDKVSSIQHPWIDAYQVNMSEAVRKSIDDYTSVNDWFTRAIDMSLRPLPNISNVTAPSDSRVSAFPTISQSRNFFKGYRLDYLTLINRVVVGGNADYFQNGILLIFRMSPQDYHRFHMPVTGVIASVTPLDGTLWSVSNDGVTSGNSVLLNQRTLVLINTTSVGTVALVAIGATCVGSVLMQLADGTPVVKGMTIPQGAQIGIMQFGGSTIAMLFKTGAVSVDSNIIYRSTFPVETLMRVNQAVATY